MNNITAILSLFLLLIYLIGYFIYVATLNMLSKRSGSGKYENLKDFYASGSFWPIIVVYYLIKFISKQIIYFIETMIERIFVKQNEIKQSTPKIKEEISETRFEFF